MKIIIVNLLILAGIALAYYTNFFGWFASKYMYIFSIIFVVGVLIAAIKILGSPFAGDKNDDHK